jgi:hypothetical protein
MTTVTPLLHLVLNSDSVANRGTATSIPVVRFQDPTRVVAGPGEANGLPLALEFDGDTPGGLVNLSSVTATLSRTKFHLRVVFSPGSVVRARDAIIHSNALPLLLALNSSRPASSDANIRAAVQNAAAGERWVRAFDPPALVPGRWYWADLVYDTDTLALFVNGNLEGVHAFPRGALAAATGPYLMIGGAASAGTGAPSNFRGKIAAVTLYSAVFPPDVESMFRPVRTHPWSYITRKADIMAASGHDIGEPQRALEYNAGFPRYLATYTRGAISYRPGDTEAFGISGALWEYWTRRRAASPTVDSEMGCFVSDEGPTVVPPGTKAFLEFAAIYAHPTHGVYTVFQPIESSYEDRGESQHTGWPIEESHPVDAAGGTRGQMQTMSKGAWFIPPGTRVPTLLNGPIWTAFQASGGAARWGIPTRSVYTNPSDAEHVEYAATPLSEWYAHATPAGITAFEVHGSILAKYMELGGHRGVLGLPTTSEIDIPGTASGSRKRMNEFQRGAICWLGSREQTFVVRPFRIRINKISSNSWEGEGWESDENDLYFYVTLKINDDVVLSRMRYPNQGYWDEQEEIEPFITLPVVVTPRANDNITLVVDLWEYDPVSSDDNLARFTKHLVAAEAWGFAENGGKLTLSAGFSELEAELLMVD